MDSTFSLNDDFHSRLMQNIQSHAICSVEEILFAITEFQKEITTKIRKIEELIDDNDDSDKTLAILIRQEQYLDALSKMPKYKLSELFFAEETKEAAPKVLKWYKKD